MFESDFSKIMPPYKKSLPTQPIFINQSVIRFTAPQIYQDLLDDIALLEAEISGDIMLDELYPNEGYLNPHTVKLHNQFSKLTRLQHRLAAAFRSEFITKSDPQKWVADPIACFHLHLNRGVCSLPLVLFHFDEPAWKLFSVPPFSSAAQWNKELHKRAQGRLAYSRSAHITEEDYLLYCKRKKAHACSLEARGRFLVRTVNQVTADELTRSSSHLYRPNPNKPVPDHLKRPIAKNFPSLLWADPNLGEVYLTAMRYTLENSAGFAPFEQPPSFQVLEKEPTPYLRIKGML